MFIFVIYRDSTIFLIKIKVAYVVNLVVHSIRLILFTMRLLKLLDFSALLSKALYTFILAVS